MSASWYRPFVCEWEPDKQHSLVGEAADGESLSVAKIVIEVEGLLLSDTSARNVCCPGKDMPADDMICHVGLVVESDVGLVA